MTTTWLLGEVLRVLWLALPVLLAGLAHVGVIKLRLLEALKVPLDGGRTLRGKRLLGDNKTWRGVVVMTLATMALAPLLWLAPALQYEYRHAHPLLVGFLLGLGFIVGELPNSFIKRQRDVAPGARGNPVFILLDQVDSLIGCLALLCAVWVAPWHVWALVIVLGSGMHMLANGVMVLVGVKERVF